MIQGQKQEIENPLEAKIQALEIGKVIGQLFGGK